MISQSRRCGHQPRRINDDSLFLHILHHGIYRNRVRESEYQSCRAHRVKPDLLSGCVQRLIHHLCDNSKYRECTEQYDPDTRDRVHTFHDRSHPRDQHHPCQMLKRCRRKTYVDHDRNELSEDHAALDHLIRDQLQPKDQKQREYQNRDHVLNYQHDRESGYDSAKDTACRDRDQSDQQPSGEIHLIFLLDQPKPYRDREYQSAPKHGRYHVACKESRLFVLRQLHCQ